MSAAVAQASKSDAITLRGSAELVAEFFSKFLLFSFMFASILFARFSFTF